MAEMQRAISNYQRRYPLQPRIGYYLQHYKIATPNADLNKVHRALTMSLGDLQAFDTYFQDLDLMADFACCVTPQVLEHVQQRVQVIDKAQSDSALADYMQAYWSHSDTPEDVI
jgi:hypothetical protein